MNPLIFFILLFYFSTARHAHHRTAPLPEELISAHIPILTSGFDINKAMGGLGGGVSWNMFHIPHQWVRYAETIEISL